MTLSVYILAKQNGGVLFQSFVIDLFQMAAPTAKGLYPMFVMSDGRCSDLTCGESDQAGQVLKVQHLDKKGRMKQNSKDSDDFVFL